MPRKKKSEKPVSEMTSEELASKVFPKKLHDKLKEIAHGSGSDAKSRSSKKL